MALSLKTKAADKYDIKRRPASLRFCLLVLIAGAFMGWAAVVVVAYYVVRSGDHPAASATVMSTLRSAVPMIAGDAPRERTATR